MNSQMKSYIRRSLGGSWVQELLSPVGLGCVTLSVHGCVHQPGSSLNPILLRFFGGFITQASLIINFISSPSPFSRARGWGGGTENSKLLIMAWSLQSPYPGAIQEPTQSPHWIKRHSYHQEITRVSLVSETGVSDQILEQKMILMLLSPRNLQGL